MRKHTKEFKSSISTFGRELDSKITVLGTELILEKEDLFSITPITNSTLLKTVMKEVDFESKKQIGIGQEINVKSGVKVNGEYEYIDYGNYFVYKSEYRAETDSYSHICYDRMLNTMIDYVSLDITYPINLREYINAIATKCGLEFADKNSTFANYNTSINEDHFNNGSYTFRDVLDYIAQLVGGWLCINDNDELEIRYPELARNYDKVSGENVSFISNVEDEINTIIVDGKSKQATRSGKNLFNKSITPIIASYGLTITELDTGVKISYTNSPSSNVAKYATYKLIDLTNYVGKVVRIKCDFSKSNEILAPRYCIGLCDVNGNNRTQESVSITSGETISFTVPTLDGTSIYLCVWLYCTYTSPIEKGDYVDFTNIIITMDNEDMTYEPYGVMPSPDYPSEIESVGKYNSETGKYEIEVKNTGKNLFDKDNANIINTYLVGSGNGVLPSNGGTENNCIYIPCKTNTTYTIQKMIGKRFGVAYTYETPAQGVMAYNKTVDNTATNITIITDSSAKYLVVYLRNGNASGEITLQQALDSLQIEKGSTSTAYEPYQSSSLLFQLDQPLRSLPNGVKDIAYIKNGILYVDRKVGTVVLDGSESWQVTSRSNGYQFQTRNSLGKIIPATEIGMLSNYFKGIKFSDRDSINESIYAYNADTDIRILTNVASTTANFKTWLSTHNTQVDYELAEPYTETIGEVETLSTFKGVNNVSLVANMQTNMTITYPTEYEELDKHFLKDVNVSFSKKYGAVNSVVFSRGNGSDNIYRKDNASINKNGLTEIKIADNPFLESDDRENFIQSLFDKINGLEFYIMDVASTGIMYLELGDFYYFNMVEEKPSLKSGLVKSGMRKAQGSSGGKFLCLLMNDEIKITQGLEESIYSDEPEITETDYKTASITDTSIKNAIIQTNKNSAEILLKVNNDEVVSAINLSPEKIKISSAKLDIDAIATFTNSKLAQAGSTVINGANITTGSINCDRLNGGTINGQAIRGGSISITTGNYYFNMGTSTSNPNCSGLNVGTYGIKAHSDITATGFAITDSDTGKSQSVNIYDGHGHVHYLTFTGGILTKWDYK